MPSTTTQRKLVSEFMGLTNATKENAQQFLKSSSYNLEAAVNKYFNGAETRGDEVEALKTQVKEKLNKLFDGLLNEQDVAADKDKNTMGAESLLAYFDLLEVDSESYEQYVVLEIIQGERFGLVSRSGFVDGWSPLALNRDGAQPDITSQKQYIRKRIEQVPKDPSYWRTLYQRAFLQGREPDQKGIHKDLAVAFWTLLFDPQVHPWRSAHVDWLKAWTEFIEAKWTRSVNRDMWSQLAIFANKTMEDETLGFWSEDQAWPGVIDDFVLWCRENGIAGAEKAKKDGADGMEVDN